MPEEKIYERQTGTRAVTPMPLTTPKDYGADLAEQVGQTVGKLNTERLQNYQLDREQTRNEEWAQLQHAFGEDRNAIDEFTRTARNDESPGHVSRVAAFVEPRLAKLLDGKTEGEVRRRGAAMIDEWKNKYLQTESDFADATRIKQVGDNEQAAADISANRKRTLTDPAQFPAELQLDHDRIDGYADIPDNVRRAWHRNADQEGWYNYGLGLIDRDPVQFKDMADKGLFDQLEPRKLESLRSNADVEIRSRQVQARTEAGVQRSAVNSQVGLAIDQVSKGQELPQGELGKLKAAATAAGLPDDRLYALDGAIQTNQVHREFRNASPDEIEGHANAADAELAKNPNQPALVLRRNALRTLATERRAQINADPHAFAAKNGVHIAPFRPDATDADINSWIAGADAVGASAGRDPKYLPIDGEAHFRDLAKTHAGKLEALAFAARFKGERAQAVARQILPNDPEFEYLVNRPKETQALALTGQEARAGNKQITHLDPTTYAKFKDSFDAQDKQFADATVGMDEGQRQAIRQTQSDLLAGFASQGKAITPALRWRAYQQALGASGPLNDPKGGIGRWGDHSFVVPSTMTAGEFTRKVQGAWAGKDGPVNLADKSKADLRLAIPRRASATAYFFVDKLGHPFMRADGSLFSVDTGR